jgi:predicted transcriptional regulator
VPASIPDVAHILVRTDVEDVVAGGSAESGRSVASRVTAILLAFHSGGTHSLTEIARLTGLPVSTTHRLLSELSPGVCSSAPQTATTGSASRCG